MNEWQPSQNPPVGHSGDQSTPSSPVPEPVSTWQYSANASDAPAYSHSNLQPIAWTASEFVNHEKQVTWFLGLAGAAVVAAGLTYLITQDVVTTVVIVIAAALFGVAAGRKPSTLKYRIDEKGVLIGAKFYPYGQFKSFSVIDEGALGSIQLMPLGRFVPPISLYYPPDQEDHILEVLGSYLPHENRKRDIVDRLMHKIRF